MNRNKEFAKNTIILFIGKFSTQFMSVLLLPLFTRYLLTSDYGYVDLLQTYIFLFLPILTLRMDSSTFRFLVDARKDKKEQNIIISSTIFVLFVTSIITMLIATILNMFIKIKYFKYLLINIFVLMIANVFLQFLRGLGKTKEYSFASIITGFFTLIINLILILCFNYNASCILISSTIANTICLFYIIYCINIFKTFRLKSINKSYIKDFLKYSIPMIPNSLSWWIVNVSDRSIITIFLGTAFNGIYTVSCKFSNILNSLFSIFNMSWQETTSLHINDEDADVYFSKMINQLTQLFATIALLIQAIIPLFFNILIGIDYSSSYVYIPILLYANTWNIIISLYGGIYIALKKTKEIANTTMVSAIINLIIHFSLVKYIGLHAACISTLLSYMIMGIYRSVDIKKYILVKLDSKKIITYTIVFIVCSVMYIYNNIYFNIINLIFIIIYAYITNKNMFKPILNKIIKVIKK